MKTMIMTLVLMASTTAMAEGTPLTLQEKKAACYYAMEVIPTDSPLTIAECVKAFDFLKLETADQQDLIGMSGQTVEDMMTSCLVWIPVSEDVQNPPNDPPFCELN